MSQDGTRSEIDGQNPKLLRKEYKVAFYSSIFQIFSLLKLDGTVAFVECPRVLPCSNLLYLKHERKIFLGKFRMRRVL